MNQEEEEDDDDDDDEDDDDDDDDDVHDVDDDHNDNDGGDDVVDDDNDDDDDDENEEEDYEDEGYITDANDSDDHDNDNDEFEYYACDRYLQLQFQKQMSGCSNWQQNQVRRTPTAIWVNQLCHRAVLENWIKLGVADHSIVNRISLQLHLVFLDS